MDVYLAPLDKEIRICPLMTTSIARFRCRQPVCKPLSALSNHARRCSQPRDTIKVILPGQWKSCRFPDQDQISSDDRRVVDVKMAMAR